MMDFDHLNDLCNTRNFIPRKFDVFASWSEEISQRALAVLQIKIFYASQGIQFSPLGELGDGVVR